VWRLKILVQFILARLPGGEQVNYLFQQLRGSHSPSHVKERVLEIFSTLAAVGRVTNIEGSRVVEVGTGWDAIAPLALYLLGAKTTISYDHVAHLRLKRVRGTLDHMQACLGQLVSLTALSKSVLSERLALARSAPDLSSLLQRAGIIYKAPADATRTALTDASVDLIYSHAVMEHVPESAVRQLAEEARRILKPGGMAVHYIGLGDHHHKCGVNFLQYSPRWWKFWAHNRIFYHNRLREKQFVEIHLSLGGSVQVISHTIRQDDLLALKTMDVARAFSGMTHEELAVYRTLIAISFNGQAPELTDAIAWSE
jgi:SAM-dependent methyltransferase